MTYRSLSLLVPTRGQLPRLELMLASFFATVGHTPVELILRIDNDDDETRTWLLQQSLPITVIIGPRWEGYISLPRYFNQMAAHATGDLLMCGNDDMVFMSDDWPRRYLAAAHPFRHDGLFDLGCWTYPAGAFPFSCVSRQTVARLGFINDDRLVYSDIFLRDVMARMGRSIIVPDVTILHMGQADHDANRVKWHLHTNAVEYWQRHDRCVSEAVSILQLGIA